MMSMKASATYTLPVSTEVSELILRYKESIEDTPWYYLNIDAIPEVSSEADRFVDKAKKELDNAMKGWKPVAEGKETHYQILFNEYSYTRYYSK